MFMFPYSRPPPPSFFAGPFCQCAIILSKIVDLDFLLHLHCGLACLTATCVCSHAGLGSIPLNLYIPFGHRGATSLLFPRYSHHPLPDYRPPSGPAALLARARAAASAPSYAAAICMFPNHSPTCPFPFGCQAARFFLSAFFPWFFLFYICRRPMRAPAAVVAAAWSLKPPQPERNSLT